MSSFEYFCLLFSYYCIVFDLNNYSRGLCGGKEVEKKRNHRSTYSLVLFSHTNYNESEISPQNCYHVNPSRKKLITISYWHNIPWVYNRACDALSNSVFGLHLHTYIHTYIYMNLLQATAYLKESNRNTVNPGSYKNNNNSTHSR